MSTPEFLHAMISAERPLFGNVAQAVLEEGLDYRPDAKARSAREILGHLIGHLLDIAEVASEGAVHHRNEIAFGDAADGAARLDAAFGEALDQLAATDAAKWMEPAKFYVGEEVIMEAPRQQVAWLLLFDAIHHRGQLSTYLRPTGSRVPSIYGPSAGDPGAGPLTNPLKARTARASAARRAAVHTMRGGTFWSSRQL